MCRRVPYDSDHVIGLPVRECEKLGMAEESETWAWVVTNVEPQHKGHRRGLPPKRFLSDDIVKLLKQTARIGAPNEFQRNLASSLGVPLNSNQATQLGKGSKQLTDPAQNLDADLTSRYVAMYGVVDEKGQISNESYRFKFGATKQDVQSSRNLNDFKREVVITGDSSDSKGHQPEPILVPAGIRPQFLAIVFSFVDTIVFSRRFPETIAIDTTMGSNKAAKPFAIAIGVGGDLKSFMPACGFLNGETVRDFSFLLTGFQLLLGKEWLKSIHVISSDGDDQLKRAIEIFKINGLLHSGVQHRRDIFHIVHQKMTKIYALHFASDGGVGNIVRKWISTWCYELESSEALAASKDALLSYLDNKRMANSTNFTEQQCELLKQFVTDLHRDSPLFAKCTRMTLVTIGQHGTGRVEAENNLLKNGGAKKITGYSSLVAIVQKIHGMGKLRMESTNVSAAFSETTVLDPRRLYAVIVTQQIARRQKFERIRLLVSARERIELVKSRETRNELIDNAVQAYGNHLPDEKKILALEESCPCLNRVHSKVARLLILEVWCLIDWCQKVRLFISLCRQLVRTDGLEVSRLNGSFVVKAPILRLSNPPWPKYPKVRIVKVVEGRLSCPCGFQVNYLLPCRHILAINRWRFGVSDIHFRWLVAFCEGHLALSHQNRSFEDAVCRPQLRLTEPEISQLPQCKHETG